MKIVLSGGGTGGHITPILAIARSLKKSNRNIELCYIGQRGHITRELLAGSGLPVYYISSGKWRRYHTERWLRRMLDVKTHTLNARDSVRAVAGLARSLQLLRRLKPDVVFVKGGYVGLPVGLAAAILRIPLIVHESDIYPGLTNRILARYAATVAVGWPVQYYEGWQKAKLITTGNPIRSELFKISTNKAKEKFKLTTELPVITITGGSQGAHNLNLGIFKQLPSLLNKFQLLHITGHLDFPHAQGLRQQLPQELRKRYYVFDFLKNDMPAALAAADVVVSRAGATAIAELAYLGKPAVIVPNPQLTGGHQTRNAGMLRQERAALVLSEKAAASLRLLNVLSAITGSRRQQQQLASAIKQLAKPTATQDLAKLLSKSGNAAQV